MRFEMVVIDIEDGKEVSIIDTEEDNVQVFACECTRENTFFCKQEVEQVLNQLNFQDEWINELIEQNKELRVKLEEQLEANKEKQTQIIDDEIEDFFNNMQDKHNIIINTNGLNWDFQEV